MAFGKELIFLAVGDIAPDREDPFTIFLRVKNYLKKADVVFGQLEAVLSNRGSPLPQARLPCRAQPLVAMALKEAGFSVISFASNHCMDWGREAFFDTIQVLKEQGLIVIGVGSNIEEARRPAIIEIKGIRLAFLAYNSILPYGYWAEEDRPGCVPLRAYTLYEQIEHDQPGTPPRIHTFAHKGDLQAMVKDIEIAKKQADFVVLSIHWGIHFVPAVIADYQREIAHVAIEHGADIILGHHPHILKGIEVYNGKVIFYSLGNFALDLRPTPELLQSPRHKEIEKLNKDWIPDPEYPSYFMPRDSRKTIIAKCIFTKESIKKVSFIPAYINPQSQPEILSYEDPRFNEVVEYLREITKEQGLKAEFCVEKDEVVVKGK
uniref:CapA family protein n=1 Tax=candidate division WOR-3 bacterium TaxID=2052148 RepID=A0A7C2K1N3_UNCW3